MWLWSLWSGHLPTSSHCCTCSYGPFAKRRPRWKGSLVSLSHVTGGYFVPSTIVCWKLSHPVLHILKHPHLANARCLPHIESFFFSANRPSDWRYLGMQFFWNTAMQPADEKGPKQQCLKFLRNIRSTRIHGTDWHFLPTWMVAFFYGKIISVWWILWGILSVRSRIVFRFCFFKWISPTNQGRKTKRIMDGYGRLCYFWVLKLPNFSGDQTMQIW